VAPSRFIALAERSGLIDPLTKWVMTEALDAQSRWRHAGLDVPVSVNLSAKSLALPDLASWILGLLAERGLPASCLTVEVTETAVADPTRAVEVLLPLHQQGIRISIDDFGTGFTSLAALPTLPVDELKVDQCFVLRSTTSAADEAIVRTVGELAHRLGLEVVAEGVETEEIARLLLTMEFDLFQGFHFAKPMSEADLLGFLRTPTPVEAGPTADELALRAVPGVRRRSAV
jgi:EAL domain-containing protein (putative c-di-GMP-specific phosphodiesterase class I)